MPDIVTFKKRGSDLAEIYDLTELPESLFRSLAITGARYLLAHAADRAALHASLLAGQISRKNRSGKPSAWDEALRIVKARRLKKEGVADPEGAAQAWWADLSRKERKNFRTLPDVIIAHAKITGRPLQEM